MPLVSDYYKLECEIRKLKKQLITTKGNLDTATMMWEIAEEAAVEFQQQLDNIEKFIYTENFHSDDSDNLKKIKAMIKDDK